MFVFPIDGLSPNPSHIRSIMGPTYENHSFGPQPPLSTESEIYQYVIIAGNTNYGGRGLYAYDKETDLLNVSSNNLKKTFCLQIYDPHSSSQSEMLQADNGNYQWQSIKNHNM